MPDDNTQSSTKTHHAEETYLNTLIKIHKQDALIRPTVNNRPAPAYKLAKFLTNKLTQLLQLPYTFALKNTSGVDHDLSNLYFSNQHRMTIFDIKDLYVKLPIHDIILATKFWLNRKHVHPLLHNKHNVLNQNYFRYKHCFYKPQKGIAIGSPLSSTAAEYYLQYLEELLIKHCLEYKHDIFYRRYVDDILCLSSMTNNTIPFTTLMKPLTLSLLMSYIYGAPCKARTIMKVPSNTTIHEEFINDEARQQLFRPYQPSSGLKHKNTECLSVT
jgi:hypothetical protein